MNTQFSQTFMTCRLFWGDQANHRPARIVCGNFLSTISSSQLLWFAISVINPSLSGSQISIPFFIYSREQGTTYRSNFDVIENAVYIRSDVTTVTDGIWLYSAGQQLQTSGTSINMITRNPWGIGSGDYYVILFGFPLRNNGLVSSACINPSNSNVYGDAYYHQNLWVIVCALNTVHSIGVPAGGYTTRNLQINGFYTPYYYLSASEQSMTIYSYYFSSKNTAVGIVTDGYPNEGPKTAASPSLTFTAIHQSIIYAGSRDDYTITFAYSSSATVDVSFTQMIAFIFPSSIDYDFT